jgi:hypothetical protein
MELKVNMPNSSAVAVIKGETLTDTICSNWKTLAIAAGLDTKPGYNLVKVTAEYNKGILGGKGGIELAIDYRTHYLDTVNPAVNHACVWVHATPDDCPEPINIPIK